MAKPEALEPEAPVPGGLANPWLFIPVLYFLQAVPVTIVQEVSTVVYKDLGIANESITRWTSLIALPWALQMLLGPLVDLSATKRNWILTGQMVISGGLIASAFLLRTPNAFAFSLVVLGLTALMSAMTNIATDGFVLLSTTKTQQARFAGFMSAFYRLGRLFCSALLVFIAGVLMRVPALDVSGGPIELVKGAETRTAEQASFRVESGKLVDAEGWAPAAEIAVPTGSFRLEVRGGEILATTANGEQSLGRISTSDSVQAAPVQGRPPQEAWLTVLLIAVGVYVAGHLICRRTAPRPVRDVRRSGPEGEIGRNIARTAALIGLGVGGYFLLNAIVRLGAHFAWTALDGSPDGPLKGWILPATGQLASVDLGLSGIAAEWVQFVICLAVVSVAVYAWRRAIRGSEVGEAIGTFVRQSGFPAILFFVLFYRFGEAVVGKITPLFLKDSIDKGGLAISNEQLGVLSGLLGVVGIILGGIIGGLMVSKIGLRRSFWYLAAAMHVPNLLYLLLSTGTLTLAMVNVPGLGNLSATLGGVLFVDQFGYGFGFAGYMVYLMWVAQRGTFVTSHYAIGTGMGALCIATAGVVSGVLQQNFGYTGVFIAVLFLSIPGLLSILFVPLDESHQRIKVDLAD